MWLNPPFDRYGVGRWIGQLAEHGRGTALLHARTETEWFRICWQNATAILFMAKRITFVKPDGTPRSDERANSGAPPVLVAFGDYDAMRLRPFAREHGGAPVDGWNLFGAASLPVTQIPIFTFPAKVKPHSCRNDPSDRRTSVKDNDLS